MTTCKHCGGEIAKEQGRGGEWYHVHSHFYSCQEQTFAEPSTEPASNNLRKEGDEKCPTQPIVRVCNAPAANQNSSGGGEISSKELFSTIKMCLGDYSHPWPNEDERTKNHREMVLDRLERIFDRYPTNELEQLRTKIQELNTLSTNQAHEIQMLREENAEWRLAFAQFRPDGGPPETPKEAAERLELETFKEGVSYAVLNEALKQNITELEAQCGVMRSALQEDALWGWNDECPETVRTEYAKSASLTSGPNNCYAFYHARKHALSGTAGREVLEKLEEARTALKYSKAYILWLTGPYPQPDGNGMEPIETALAKIDGGGK